MEAHANGATDDVETNRSLLFSEPSSPQGQHHPRRSNPIAHRRILLLFAATIAYGLLLLEKEDSALSPGYEDRDNHGGGTGRIHRTWSSFYHGARLHQCQALQYAKLTCPSWDPDFEDGGEGVDYRVRWIDNHQNARNDNRSCQNSNYFFRAFHGQIGFGANVYMVVQSSLYIALYSNRIFLLEPEVPFLYGGCKDHNWECYFQPLSRCTAGDAEAIVAGTGSEYGDQHLNASHKVLRASKVTQLASTE